MWVRRNNIFCQKFVFYLSVMITCITWKLILLSDEEAAVSGNSHLMNDSTAKLNNKDAPAAEIVPAKPEASPRKEQSVLQTKLTKLAIQIGYAGMFLNSWLLERIIFAVINSFYIPIRNLNFPVVKWQNI